MDLEYRGVPCWRTKASCDVKLIDDASMRMRKTSRLPWQCRLFRPDSEDSQEPRCGIDGPNDESLIYLPHHEYIFNENAGTVEIEVIRQGSDLSHTSMVWCAPKPLNPPSANPGEDFVPSASQLTFRPQQTVEVCRITIVDDTASPRMEGNETFLVYLSSAMGSALSAPHEAS
ncbi:putative extracellular matrix protein FRAS1 [Apostichopus japonicus]|uniref:Putative extracellular matrix protein FRAS1 n=1 Tax=Stichopus japonicus TaxID=307972 RepID=A0A2G8KS08_STIJA|nr:putative extracellular matrix protein FRAS1 [Apostichopus japonicus]